MNQTICKTFFHRANFLCENFSEKISKTSCWSFPTLSGGIEFHLNARVVRMRFRKTFFLSTESTLIESIKVFLYLRLWLTAFSHIQNVYLPWMKQQQIVHNHFMFMFYSLGDYLFPALILSFKRFKESMFFLRGSKTRQM